LAGAQQKADAGDRHPRRGGARHAAAQRNITAFRESLAETGYVEGRNVAIEYRWASGDFNRLPGLAAELVARKVDLIVTEGGDDPVRAAKQASAGSRSCSTRTPIRSKAVRRQLSRPGAI